MLASLLISVAGFEAGVRLLGVQAWTSPHWTYHPVLGWTQMPERRFAYTTRFGERVVVETNAHGFRDIEHTVDRPPGIRRLVVIGDSFSAAIEVNLEGTFWKRLEALLNHAGPDRWEVINLATGDWGTAQEWLALKQYGFAYDPDVVLLQIFPLNDICNNAIELAGLCRSGNDDLRPYFTLRGRGRGRGLEPASTQRSRNWLRRHSLTLRLLDGWWRLWRHRIDPPAQRDLDPDRLRVLGLGRLPPLLHSYVPVAHQAPVISAAWETTERLLLRINQRCKERGVKLLVMLAPFEVRLGERWEHFAAGRPPPPMERDYADDRLMRLFRAENVPIVSMKQVFDLHLDRVLPSRAGHFSPAAHALAAQALYDLMQTSGILDAGGGEDFDEAEPSTGGAATSGQPGKSPAHCAGHFAPPPKRAPAPRLRG